MSNLYTYIIIVCSLIQQVSAALYTFRKIYFSPEYMSNVIFIFIKNNLVFGIEYDLSILLEFLWIRVKKILLFIIV